MEQIQDENEAITRLLKGDLDAFNFLYRKYNQAVFQNIYKFVRNQCQAEDILQEVFISFWEHRDIFIETRNVSGWLFRVSFNNSIKALQKRQKEPVVHTDNCKILELSPVSMDYDESEYQNMLDLIEEAVSQLPDKKQKVFRLYRMENKKPEEISKELGLTLISVKDYIKQATKMVRQYINAKSEAEISFVLLILLLGR